MSVNKSYPIPVNEKKRLKALYDYNILDTIPEKEYDGITKIAAQICNVPVSFLSFIDKDRQWYKSYFGVELHEIPREISLCTHAILNPDVLLVVPDMRLDERFANNPLVKGEPHAVFYASASLVTSEGDALGTICVLDAKVNNLNDDQKDALRCLADQVMTRLELRRKVKELNNIQKQLKKANSELKDFASIASHDMKTPLANISLVSKSFRIKYKEQLDEDAAEYLTLIDSSAKELLVFIDDILTKSIKAQKNNATVHADSYDVINKVIRLIALPDDIEIKITGSFPKVKIDKTSLQQVFQNLITNAIKYNDKEKGMINISYSCDKSYHYFDVTDNGSGIDKEELCKIFDKRKTLEKTDRYGNKGTGLGLANVKDIVESTGGKISVASEKYAGSVFKIALPVTC